jgi:3-oxoacyl-(acyl-carrier-protein) synthase
MRRHAADAIVVGSTGSRIQTLRTIHVVLQEQCAAAGVAPEKASRPFDANRKGMVIGEGAGVLVLEDADVAAKRGAKVWGEVVGYAPQPLPIETESPTIDKPSPTSSTWHCNQPECGLAKSGMSTPMDYRRFMATAKKLKRSAIGSVMSRSSQ